METNDIYQIGKIEIIILLVLINKNGNTYVFPFPSEYNSIK